VERSDEVGCIQGEKGTHFFGSRIFIKSIDSGGGVQSRHLESGKMQVGNITLWVGQLLVNQSAMGQGERSSIERKRKRE